MIIKKNDNQYYGELFERFIAAIKSENDYKEEISKVNFTFPEEHIQIIYEHAKKAAEMIPGTIVEYLGRKTNSESGDLKVDNQLYEIKYVSGGSGTWLNTSVSYFSEYDCGINFFEIYQKYNYQKEIQKILPENIIVTNNHSPVNQKTSSYIRHNLPDTFNFIRKIEALYREKALRLQDQYFKENPEKQKQFILDCFSKKGARKELPNYILIFNRQENRVYLVNTAFLLNDLENKNIILTRALWENSYKCGDMRVTISWQNGIGLNNFTIRVFLEKEFLEKYARIR